MREKEVPQDPSFYKGLERICFAVDDEGSYVPTTSAGWEVERLCTEQALLELEDQVERTRQDVIAGKASPLAYHLAAHQMPPRLFAQHVGLATWRVKRHLKPGVFAKLTPELLARYAHCLDLDVEELGRVPAERVRVFFEDSAGSPAAPGQEPRD